MTPEKDTQIAAYARVKNALQAAWSRASAEGNPLALILVGFDKPETEVGAGILERALRVHCARTHDIFMRRTFDEYIAVLPDTPPAGARHVGEQLVESMRAEDTDHMHRVSVGVAVAVPDEQRDAFALLRRAESALQAARDHGGDRCVGGAGAVAPPPPEGALARLRALLSGKKKESEFKRRTD